MFFSNCKRTIMKSATVHAVLLAILTAAAMPRAAVAEEKLAEQLKAFAPYVGKTWKGEFAGSKPEKPIFDVSRCERVLNGQGVRILHSVNDGQYGGETMIIW